jgi:hypothetical protein
MSVSKSFAGLVLVISSSLASSLLANSAFADLGCQHPYCNGPESVNNSTPPAAGPTIYHSQYCGEGHCYPGAYIPGEVDKDGSTAPAPSAEAAQAVLAAPAVAVAPAGTAAPTAADLQKQELADVGVERFTAQDYKPGLVRHIVLFRYKSDVSAAQKQEVIRRFLALKTLARRNGKEYIASIQTGSEISGEAADQGLEQGFIVTFRSQGDRNYYVGQPVVTDSNFYEASHQAFKDFVGPLLDAGGALVFDFAL